MRFAFTDEQELTRNAFRELLSTACTPAMVRTAFASGAGRIPELGPRLSEFGAFGAAIPEGNGGLGLGAVELMLLLEESGRAALPEPLLETAAAAHILVAFESDPRFGGLLGRVIGGTSRVAVAWASRPYVVDADLCEALLLERGDELHLVPRAGVDVSRQETVDRTRRLFRVSCRADASTRVSAGARVTARFAEAFDLAALGAAAELVGLATRATEMAIEYAKTRRQFEQPIGSFQAVKHLLADAHLGIAFARPLVYRAAHSITHRDPAASQHVSSAKAFASDAAWKAARTALQVHGAIGYSYEHDLHLWMKRIWALAAEYGDAAWHRERVATTILDPKRTDNG